MLLPEFKSLQDLEKAFPNEQSCIDHLERIIWNGKLISPFDPTSKVYKCANNRYKCKNTGKYFNVKTKTIFENSKIPLREWFRALFLFSVNRGISSYRLAKHVDITAKSAWFLLNRLRHGSVISSFRVMLKDFVEIDETFIGGKNKNRHKNKKVPNSQGRNWKDKIPVWGAVERGGKLIAQVVPNTQKNTLVPIIKANVKKGSHVNTDEWLAYENLCRWFNHDIVNHSAKQYVKGETHTNSIESAWAFLKRIIYGIYHWISRKHAQRYIDEFTMHYNTRKYSTQERFDLILLSSKGKRLTYRELIG